VLGPRHLFLSKGLPEHILCYIENTFYSVYVPERPAAQSQMSGCVPKRPASTHSMLHREHILCYIENTFSCLVHFISFSVPLFHSPTLSPSLIRSSPSPISPQPPPENFAAQVYPEYQALILKSSLYIKKIKKNISQRKSTPSTRHLFSKVLSI